MHYRMLLLHKVVTHKCRLLASSRLCHWLKLAALNSGLKTHNAAKNTPATVSIVPLHTASTCYMLSLESTVLHCKDQTFLVTSAIECISVLSVLGGNQPRQSPNTHYITIVYFCLFVHTL